MTLTESKSRQPKVPQQQESIDQIDCYHAVYYYLCSGIVVFSNSGIDEAHALLIVFFIHHSLVALALIAQVVAELVEVQFASLIDIAAKEGFPVLKGKRHRLADLLQSHP